MTLIIIRVKAVQEMFRCGTLLTISDGVNFKKRSKQRPTPVCIDLCL